MAAHWPLVSSQSDSSLSQLHSHSSGAARTTTRTKTRTRPHSSRPLQLSLWTSRLLHPDRSNQTSKTHIYALAAVFPLNKKPTTANQASGAQGSRFGFGSRRIPLLSLIEAKYKIY